MSKPHIVCSGGGTGQFTVLSGLKNHDVELSSVVSIADNGGSTGILRDELGVLPPGDIRQCLVALATGDKLLRELFAYRFHEGSLSGHNFGNLFLSVLEKVTGDSLSAVKAAQRILNVKGRVIPASALSANLYAELTNGVVLEGEHMVDGKRSDQPAIRRCFLSPDVQANPEALEAIKTADLVIIGPGDLYTSLIPVLLVQGIRESLAQRTGKTCYVVNLVIKPGQIQTARASAYVSVINQYLMPGTLTDVVVNVGQPAGKLLERYTEAGELLVSDDLDDWEDPKVHRVDCLAADAPSVQNGDGLERSLIRHHPDKLAAALLEILGTEKNMDSTVARIMEMGLEVNPGIKDFQT